MNVLIALLDPAHPHHDISRDGFALAARRGWATCPITENGVIRVLAAVSYPGIRLRAEDAVVLLDTLVANHSATYQFWQDGVHFRDGGLFRRAAIAGPKQLTDIYLLGLCQRNGGTLVTLDTAITTAAIVTPDPDLLHCLL